MPDTAAHPPVGPQSEGTFICKVHEEAFRDIYLAVQKGASKTLLFWTLGVFAAVGAAFGGSLWGTTALGLGNNDKEVRAIKDRTLRIEIEMGHIKNDLKDVKIEQKSLRRDMKREFEKVRLLIKENGNGG